MKLHFTPGMTQIMKIHKISKEQNINLIGSPLGQVVMVNGYAGNTAWWDSAHQPLD